MLSALVSQANGTYGKGNKNVKISLFWICWLVLKVVWPLWIFQGLSITLESNCILINNLLSSQFYSLFTLYYLRPRL